MQISNFSKLYLSVTLQRIISQFTSFLQEGYDLLGRQGINL